MKQPSYASTHVVIVSLSMAVAALLAWSMTPSSTITGESPNLAGVIPRAFGEWVEIPASGFQVDPAIDETDRSNANGPYDDVLMRSYRHSGNGRTIDLAVAYGRTQVQERKIHRPELCYTSQGFRMVSLKPVSLSMDESSFEHISARRMVVESPDRLDAVSYWIRIGDTFTDDPWVTRYYLFREGLKGRLHDGVLVRVSQTFAGGESVSEQAFLLQEEFLRTLSSALSPSGRKLILGTSDLLGPPGSSTDGKRKVAST